LHDTDEEQVQRIVEGLNASDREHVYYTVPQCCGYPGDAVVDVVSAEDVHARARCNNWCYALLFVVIFALSLGVACLADERHRFVIVAAGFMCSAVCIRVLDERQSSWHDDTLRLLKEKQKVPDEKV